MLDKAWLRSFILSIVKPLKSGKVTSYDDDNLSMDNIATDGNSPKFRLTNPFGFVSGIPAGVTGFYQALNGSGFESIMLATLHKLRPRPSAAGETILYSTTPDGKTIKVKITLKNDGSLEIDAPTTVNINAQNVNVNASTKAKIDAPAVELSSGALEKVLNGETFQTFFNQHQHIDGVFGVPVSVPIVQSGPSHLSDKVQAAK